MKDKSSQVKHKWGEIRAKRQNVRHSVNTKIYIKSTRAIKTIREKKKKSFLIALVQRGFPMSGTKVARY